MWGAMVGLFAVTVLDLPLPIVFALAVLASGLISVAVDFLVGGLIFGIIQKQSAYKKRRSKPGRRTDFINDPAVIARREQALARLAAAE